LIFKGVIPTFKNENKMGLELGYGIPKEKKRNA